MTKALQTLIKLHKNKLDKIVKEIEFNEVEKVRLHKKKTSIVEEMNSEIEKFSTTEFGFMLEKYVENSRSLLRRFDAQINQINRIIDRLRVNLKDQYSELKKYEIALANKKVIENELLKKYEAKEIDDFNINQFASMDK